MDLNLWRIWYKMVFGERVLGFCVLCFVIFVFVSFRICSVLWFSVYYLLICLMRKFLFLFGFGWFLLFVLLVLIWYIGCILLCLLKIRWIM